MKVICPDTGNEIPADQVNAATDIAYSPWTGKTHKLSSLIESSSTSASDVELLNSPPAKTWYRREGSRTVVGAKERPVGTIVFFLIFTIFWNSILSVFLFGPYIAPEMAEDGAGKFGQDAFMTLFLIPFILVGLGTLFSVLFMLFGKVEVSFTDSSGSIFTGIGPWGLTRSFDPTTVQSVRVKETSVQTNGRNLYKLVIDDTKHERSLGFCLSNERRDFIAAVLRAELIKPAP